MKYPFLILIAIFAAFTLSTATAYAQQDNATVAATKTTDNASLADNISALLIEIDSKTADNATVNDKLLVDDNVSVDNVSVADNATTSDNRSVSTGSDNASDYIAPGVVVNVADNGTSLKDVYVMLNGGIIIPEKSYYNTSYQFGATIGFQITELFAIDASVLYQSFNASKTGLQNLTSTDIKAVALYQPSIQMSPKLFILPNVGGGLVYTFKNGYTSNQQLGALATAGVKFAYDMFIAGVAIEYSYKGGDTGGFAAMINLGIRFTM